MRSLYRQAKRIYFVTAVAVAMATSVSPLYAQIERDDLDRKAYEVYQQVFSPFCPGRSLNDCPSSKAHDLKLEIRQQLEQGADPAVVLERVFQRFGDQYRAVPQYSGFGKLVWWAPLSFLIIGAIVALFIARGRRGHTGSAVGHTQQGDLVMSSRDRNAQSAAPVSEDLRRQIEAELAQLE
jgi:cytochrome c-type biogenesis protein CcmH/NrfF